MSVFSRTLVVVEDGENQSSFVSVVCLQLEVLRLVRAFTTEQMLRLAAIPLFGIFSDSFPYISKFYFSLLPFNITKFAFFAYQPSLTFIDLC